MQQEMNQKFYCQSMCYSVFSGTISNKICSDAFGIQKPENTLNKWFEILRRFQWWIIY